MTKPVFPLTWGPQRIPVEVQNRIRPAPSSPILRNGTGFRNSKMLSQPLLQILNTIQQMVFYSNVIKTTPSVLQQPGFDFFRILNCQTEHQLLRYIYTDKSELAQTPEPDIELHPIESVTRVACICFLNHLLIVSPPSSGLGRALTKHLAKEIRKFKLNSLNDLSKESLALLAWSLFIGAQGANCQPERRFFVQRLARIATICGWRSWEQISWVLTDYYFSPEANGLDWRAIWDEAMAGFVIPGSVEEA